MLEKLTRSKLLTLLLLTGAVYFFLKYISPLVAPALVALLFLTACNPTFNKINKKTKIPKNILAAAVFITLGLLLAALLWFGLVKLAISIPGLISGFDMVEQKFYVLVGDCCDILQSRFGMNGLQMEQVILEKTGMAVNHFQEEIVPGMMSESWMYVRYALAAGAFLAIMVIATILLAKDYDKIMFRLGETEEYQLVLDVIQKVIHYIFTFLKAQLIIMSSIGALCTIALFWAKVDNAFFFGCLAGVLDMLPFIGTGIVLVPLALWQILNGWYGKAVVCLVIYGACGILREFLEPKLIGEKIGLYPIAILLAVFAGIKLFGLWGILKGPLGLVMIYQTYVSIYKKAEPQNLKKKQVPE